MRGENHMMLVLFCLIVLSHFLPSVNSNPQLAPALYVLGDSSLDSGNNNLLPTLAKANFMPYGVDFAGGATGRFTNGRTIADFIAEFLGLPLSPPYLSFRPSETLTGLNYASSTCGILPETGSYLGKCLNLDEQIDLFEKTVTEDLAKHFKNTIGLLEYLSKSIFLIATGSNDYLGNYLNPNIYDSSKLYSPLSFAQLLTASLSQKLERLYKLGARKVITFEIGPLGCTPSILRQYMHKNGQCVEEINNLASLFNDQLATMLSKLTSTLPGSAFILGRDYRLGYDAIINPSTYGLTDTSDPCCTTLNGTSICKPETAPCTNPNKYFFWDGVHLTEAVYSVIASQCFNGDSVCIPTNLKKLIQI